jgi:hypothetical protein
METHTDSKWQGIYVISKYCKRMNVQELVGGKN